MTKDKRETYFTKVYFKKVKEIKKVKEQKESVRLSETNLTKVVNQ